jgi:hypothetical protein
MAASLENKADENPAGKDAKQLESEGYKPLSSTPGYMFKSDGKPRLYKLDGEKKMYFPVNAAAAF